MKWRRHNLKEWERFRNLDEIEGCCCKRGDLTTVIEEQIMMVNLWDRRRTAWDKHVGT